MLNNIATIERIHNITEIPGADNIETAHILGYTSVIKKGEFNIGDYVIFVYPDTQWLNPPSEYAFLGKYNFRIRSMRLRGQLSYGLVIKLPDNWEKIEGLEVSENLGITKYEKPLPTVLGGKVMGYLPFGLFKTDEILLQSKPDLLDELFDKDVYVTVKCDGSSGTFAYKDGDFRVCSRTMDLYESNENVFWQLAKKLNLQSVLADYYSKTGKNIALRGEVCGPDIQRNKMGFKEHQLLIFDAFDLDKMRYLDYTELLDI